MGEAIAINSWQSVENLILRPPRSDTYGRDDLLGSHDGEFTVTGVDRSPVRCFRMDIEVRCRAAHPGEGPRTWRARGPGALVPTA